MRHHILNLVDTLQKNVYNVFNENFNPIIMQKFTNIYTIPKFKKLA